MIAFRLKDINILMLVTISYSIVGGMNIISKLDEGKEQVQNLLNLTSDVLKSTITEHPVLTAIQSVAKENFGKMVIADDVEMIEQEEANKSNYESPIGTLITAIFRVSCDLLLY